MKQIQSNVEQAGVYILYNEKEPVYVGLTRNVKQRIIAHKSRYLIDFNSFIFIPCPARDAPYLENACIAALRPKSNGRAGWVFEDDEKK